MPTIAELFALAVRHHQSGDLRQAEGFYRQVLQANPNHADTHSNLGVALAGQGRLAEASDCHRQALRLDPNHVAAHISLGATLQELGQLEEAIHCYRQALRINPNHAQAHYNLGSALKEKGQLAEAINCYRQALHIDPNYADAHSNLGIALKEQGRLGEAIDCYRQALRFNPDHAVTYTNLGVALKEQGQLVDAVDCHKQALRIDPNFAEAHINLGAALQEQGRLNEALHAFRQALRINPNHVDALCNMGIALKMQGELAEGDKYFQQALAIDPGNKFAIWNQAYLRLLQGDFEKGWPAYEARWTLFFAVPRSFQKPRWDGSSLDGRTILVWAEQGLGDTIQFVRYLPMVKERGGRVILECQPALTKLLAGLPGVDQIIAAGTPLPAYDVQVPLLSLPGLFQTTLTTIPANVPYLEADLERTAFWAKELASVQGFKIGICWQGSSQYPGDHLRSFPLKHFDPLAKLARVRLVSLQVGPAREQLATVPLSIIDLGPGSLEDLAAAIVNLDLIVTADTAVAHLAGALGVSVWVALPFAPDWRWLRERSDSPWYPTLRLFRQRIFGDWGEVFERIAEEVQSAIRK